jgi:HprK-related kinase B
MNGLVVMTWKRDGRPMRAERVDLASRRDLLPAFMKDVGLFFESDGPGQSGPEATADEYLALLSGCPVLEISGAWTSTPRPGPALISWPRPSRE